MKLKFWGVRGSCPVPGSATLEFGGNTPCVELEGSGSDVILFDAGTGIRAAGVDLLARAKGSPLRVHLYLTHFHSDHIQGLPFFKPLFDSSTHITIYSSGFSSSLRQALTGLMAAPYFPVSFDSVGARVELRDLGSAASKNGALTVRPIEVCHPQGACAYRVDYPGGSFVYAPDREHGDARLDPHFIDCVRGATALVTDAQYTPEEYEAHRGWGHTTWLEATRVAREAQVQSLVLFSHDPAHSDDLLKRIETDARREFADTFVAKEGWEFEL